MSLFDRHKEKAFSALIIISGAATLLFLYHLQRTLCTDTSPPPPVSTLAVQTKAAANQKLKTKAHYQLIAQRNLFVFPEGTRASRDASSSKYQPAEETTLNLRLKGTIVSPKGIAYAMVEDRAQRKEDLYVVGDQVQNAEIVEIMRERIIIKHAGRKEMLTLFTEEPGRGARGGSSARAVTPQARAPSRPERAGGPTTASSSRQVQQKIRSLMAQLRLRPHFKDGKPAGFEVGQVREGSVFEARGLKKGDIIVAINDEDIRTPNQLLKAYREVAEEEELWLDILRDGKEEDTIEIDLEGIITSQ